MDGDDEHLLSGGRSRKEKRRGEEFFEDCMRFEGKEIMDDVISECSLSAETSQNNNDTIYKYYNYSTVRMTRPVPRSHVHMAC